MNWTIGEKVLTKDELVPLVRTWFESKTPPHVFSFPECNNMLTERGLYYRMPVAVAAYTEVVYNALPHKVEIKRQIDADEQRAFFEQYGGSGLMAGFVRRPNVEWVYCFSTEAEAAFFKVAL